MFSDWFDKKLAQTGQTERSLASALGVSQQAVSRWRTGAARPSRARLESLARELRCSVTEVVEHLVQDSNSLVQMHETSITALAEQVEALHARLVQLDDLLSPSRTGRDEREKRQRDADEVGGKSVAPTNDTSVDGTDPSGKTAGHKRQPKNRHLGDETGELIERSLGLDVAGARLASEFDVYSGRAAEPGASSAGIGSWRSRVGPQAVFTWEDATYRIFGIKAGTPVRNIDVFNLVHPDDRMRLVEAILKSRSHRRSEEAKVRVTLPEGSLRQFLLTVAAEFDHDGAPVGLCGTVQDVTDR